MSLKLNKLSPNYIIFILLGFIFKYKIYYCQIYDNFSNIILEEGSELIDVNDYQNLKLIVSTSKKIYSGIPPILKTTTEANLINSSSIITLDSDYILASCLQDSLLAKININNGSFKSLLNYTDSSLSSLNLEIPKTSCSLSNIDNTIFIGYSKLNYFENEINKTNIIIRLNVTNINSVNGPELDTSSSIKYFKFPKSTIKTDSTKQIACEPLRISDDTSKYRLICIYETFEYIESDGKNRYNIYVVSLNNTFISFEEEKSLYRIDNNSGFKLYRLNSTYAKCMIRKLYLDLYIQTKTSSNPKIISIRSDDISLKIVLDLFDYSNKTIFYIEKTTFANKSGIYCFKIIRESSTNYFVFYDYKEKNIKKILCYYDISKNYIIMVFQTSSYIKYFSILNFEKIFKIKASDIKSKKLKIKSNEDRDYYNVSEMTNITSYGSLNVLEIRRYKNQKNYKNESFGIDFNELIMNDNKIYIKKTYNDWYDYYLAFIEHIKNNYTRIYYIGKLLFELRTCFPTQCESCRENYEKCDDCKYENYSLIKDSNKTCYSIDKLIKGYFYNKESKLFEKCYSSCDFCNSTYSDNSLHYCLSCSDNYLPSYKIPGNCYKIDDENFITSSCPKYKIYSTGECIEKCPSITPYYSFEYNIETENYDRINLNPFIYLFNKICYEICPTNTIADDINKICKCKFAYYNESDELKCFSDNNCLTEYSYQNPETKECFSSLEDCFIKQNNYFFNKECYKNRCPDYKIALNTQSSEIKNYFKVKLSLDDNIINKLCICNINNGVWSNFPLNNELYFQECLTSCPEGYKPENITHHCIEDLKASTTEITTIMTEPLINEITMITTEPTNLPSSQIEKILSTEISTISTDSTSTEITTNTSELISLEKETINIDKYTEEITNITSLHFNSEKIAKINETLIIDTSKEKEIINKTIPSTSLQTIKTEPSTEKQILDSTESLIKESAIFISKTSLTEKIDTTEIFITDLTINNHKVPENDSQTEFYKYLDNCKVIYNKKCYNNCPEGTCISQNDIQLKKCIPIEKNVTVFNDICFENMNKIINNIKNMSENNEVISNSNGIIIHAYSTKSEPIEEPTKRNYSVVYLGKCEKLLKNYYNLSEDTELYILGIDSPNKNENYSTNVFNYDVFLEDGTLLDYENVCKGEKVIISSLIVNSELSNFKNATYFSNFGYDIYDENNSFYTDNCAPASIDNNDITLEDRKKYYYPDNVSLCNDSCKYMDVDIDAQRFTCECLISNNTSDSVQNNSEVEDITYIEYFLSFINYKILVCYKLFFDYKNYYYNAGFYIAIFTFVFCFVEMVIFLIWGLRDIKLLIIKNAPNKIKLKDAIKKQKEKKENLNNLIKYNPIKKFKVQKNDNFDIYNLENEKGETNKSPKYINNKESQIELKNNIIHDIIKIRPKHKKKKKKKKKSSGEDDKNSKTNINLLLFISKTSQKKQKNERKKFGKKIFKKDSKRDLLGNNKNAYLSFRENEINKQNEKVCVNNNYDLVDKNNDNEVDKKDLNIIPYYQALRLDNRNYFEMFLSFLANEIEIIKIFYYRNNYEHISITLSLYIFESCVDFTLNCFLCNDSVVSQKYHNNGSIEFITSLTLSCLSNMISSLLVFLIGKLNDYGYYLEYILKEIFKKNQYFSTYMIFKKYLAIKLTLFFLLEISINLGMCYYLMIFCSIYKNIQGSIMINYFLGICQSMILSLGIAIFSSFIRFLSLKYNWRYLYYTSKHLFENSNIEVLF